MSNPDLSVLCTVLATLYPTPDDVRRVTEGVGLWLNSIQLNNNPLNNWNNILTETENYAKIAALIKAARLEHSADSALVDVARAYGLFDEKPVDRSGNKEHTFHIGHVEQINLLVGNDAEAVLTKTDGGTYVKGNVNPGGDFVGRNHKTIPVAPNTNSQTTHAPTNFGDTNVDDTNIVNDQSIKWAPLWSSPRIEDLPRIAEWVRMAQLKVNPFGPEQAELDPELLIHHVYPSVFEDCLRNVRSAVIFGAPGSGKTACKLLLAHTCHAPVSVSMQEVNIFPVLCSVDCSMDKLVTVEQVQNFVVEHLARALIPFFALNPVTFLALEDDAKFATVACLRHPLSLMENLKAQLSLAGLLKHRLGNQMLQELDRLAPRLQNASFIQRDWVEIISKARPQNFTRTFIICDLSNTNQATVQSLSAYLQQLINYVVSPDARSVYLKAFFPDELRTAIKLPSHVTTCTLLWTVEQLEQMLQNRLLSRNGFKVYFEQLFEPGTRQTKPARRLAEAAQGSPQRLIYLGNRLLSEHVHQRRGEVELTDQELTVVLNEAQGHQS